MSDACDAFRNFDACQASAIVKRTISDACDAFRNRDACQVATKPKCRISDACDAFFNHNFFYTVTIIICRAIVNSIVNVKKIILHRPCAADGHCAVGIQCPGQVVFFPIDYDLACIYTEVFACQRRAALKAYD